MHVEEVARGLAARGHEVHVVALAGDGDPPKEFELHPSPMLFEHRVFRWTARRGVGALVEKLGVDAVMERYYNFAGEGVRAAAALGVPALLEINAPLKEYPGSLKSRIDRLLLVRPMERLRNALCAKASALVTPLPSIIPEEVPAEKVHRVHWGANVERFHPDVARSSLAIPEDRPVVVFSGSFRPWHGADALVRVAAKLPRRVLPLHRRRTGAGEDTVRLAQSSSAWTSAAHFTGAVPYDDVPASLEVGIGGRRSLPARRVSVRCSSAFFGRRSKSSSTWRSGMPVVSLDVEPLRAVVRPSEGSARG